MAKTRAKASTKKGKRKKKPSSRGFSLLGFLFKLSLVGIVCLAVLLVYLDASIRQQFEGKRWAIPAKVYARPLELYSGQALTPADLKIELSRLGYRFVQSPKQPGQASLWKNKAVVYSRGFSFPDSEEKARLLTLTFSGQQLAKMADSRGKSVALARLDPVVIGGIYPANNEDRELVELNKVPSALVDALIAVEDRNFYQHYGISFTGIARAMWNNLRAGQVVQGGSTLTQQLVKNFFLTSERSIWRKLIEAPMAMLLELHYSKDDILEAYLNEVYLGQSGARAIHGFGLASHYYFGRPLTQLRTDQLAMLAGLVKGPSYYDPRRHPKRATKRRNLVLQLLADQGYLSQQQALNASKKSLGVIQKSRIAKGAFPAYLDLVKRQLRQEYREEDLSSEGLRIFTNLDPIVQAKAENSLAQIIAILEKHHGKKLQKLEGAITLSNTQTGEVIAVVGGRDPRYQGFNRALDAVRPIGSLVKPAVYLTALSSPEKYSLISMLDDQPVRLKTENGELWQPKNFDKKIHGEVPLHQALAKSYNLATAHLGLDLGMGSIIDTLQQLGIERDIPSYPATLLGSLSLSPIEVMQMYQTIAANGYETPLRAIRSVTTSSGDVLTAYRLQLDQQFDPGVMHLLQYNLQETVREGTAKSVYNRFPDALKLAGKTGTTNDQRDSWFAGFTGDYLAVVWLGRDDNKPMPLTGSSGALQVWADLISDLKPLSYENQLPPNVAYHWVDESQGLLTGEGCEGARLVPFIKGTEPQDSTHCADQPSIKGIRDWFTRLFSG